MLYDVTSGFRCYVNETCDLLGLYEAYSGNARPPFWLDPWRRDR